MDLVGTADLLDVGILQLWITPRPDHVMPNEEVSGSVKFSCSKSLSIRGLWVKFTGFNILKGLSETKNKTHEGVDLLTGDADHYLGGIHDVLLGFGEQDEIERASDAAIPLLPLACGDHKWNFSFQIPSEAPFSYCDKYTVVSYIITIYLDIPEVSKIASQISCSIKVGCTGFHQTTQANSDIPLSSRILGNDLSEIVSVKVQPLLKRFLRASLGRTDDETSMKLSLVPGSIPSSAIFEFQSVQTILKVRCTLVVADKTAVPLKIVARLLVCINLRNDATVPFQNIRKLVESCHTTGRASTIKKCSVVHTGVENSGFCHTIWTSSVDVGCPKKSNIGDFDVPIYIDPEIRASCLAEQPTPQPLPHDTIDSILSFSTSGPLFEYKVVLEVTVYQGNQSSPSLPACIGEIFIRPPTPDRPAHRRSPLHSVVRSPQNGVIRATNSASEERNSICPVVAGATTCALYSADEDLCSFSMVDNSLQLSKNITIERIEEKDRDSIRNKNTKKVIRGPATPHARILIPEVMGEAVSRGPAAVLCDRANHPHRMVQIPPSRFAAACRVGSGATVVGDASAVIPLGSTGATDCSNDSRVTAYLSTHVDNDCSSPLDVLRTPQRIGSHEESDQPGRTQRLSFTLPRFSTSASCPDEVADNDSMDFNLANHSPPLIMMSRPHPESVSLSRPLVLRY